MSAANVLSPKPQSFSKIFRPWDEAATEDKICVEEVKTEVLETSVNNQNIASDPYMLPPYLNGYYTKPLPGLINPMLSDIYGLSPTKCMDLLPPSAVQFADPSCGFNLMDVERVLIEEARAKAMNSRKQRPKKFKCPHCNVAFSNNGQLKGHIRIHTGERPFKCDDPSCNKTFTRNEELTRHKRIHTGIRPYGCPQCGKKFGRRDHLKKHMKTHLPQERYVYYPIFNYPYY